MELMDKMAVRRDTAVSLGKRIEELLEGAERKAHEACGAKKAMAAHSKNLIGISTAADAEVGKSIPDIEHLKPIKEWLGKCIAATENLVGHFSNIEMQCLGEVAAYKASRDAIFKVVKEIDDGTERLSRAIEEGSVGVAEDGSLQQVGPGPRLPGVRPGPSISQQRKSEEQEATKVSPSLEGPASKKGKSGKK